MKIVFSMDGIKNMDQLYTWTTEYAEDFNSEGKVEHYHGTDYCKAVVDSLSGWKEKRYIGSYERIANETFILTTMDDVQYTLAFSINTYKEKVSRLEVSITAPDTESYDSRLETLKITLKDRLLPEWQECTWLVDEQAAMLCKEAYERAFIIENKLRAFASKVLIHFLGVNWLQRVGLEKEAESVEKLKERFIQRVPEFDNINADFLSMTLETLVGIMLEGVVYKEDIVLTRQDYKKLMEICDKAKSVANVANYIRERRVQDKRIWEELFFPFIDCQDDFKSAIHDFIEDRNHVAHSKVLSWTSYQRMLRDFQKMDLLIYRADLKFDQEETSEELLATWEADQGEDYDPEYEKGYYRDRLVSETGMEILDEDGINDWFDEVLHDLFSEVYQRYHLDVSFELSDFFAPSEGDVVFSISCPVDVELSISVYAEYSIDDDFGGDSTCNIVVKNTKAEEICSAEVRFHNGSGYEGEEGLMEVDDNTEYDTSEIEDFKDALFAAIEDMNPYPAMAEAIAYRNKGAVQVVAGFPCEQCGKFGVSVDEELLPTGKCCFCGWENELIKCKRCGELFGIADIDGGLCPSCVSAIEKH